jgi:hypothetical protein
MTAETALETKTATTSPATKVRHVKAGFAIISPREQIVSPFLNNLQPSRAALFSNR